MKLIYSVQSITGDIAFYEHKGRIFKVYTSWYPQLTEDVLLDRMENWKDYLQSYLKSHIDELEKDKLTKFVIDSNSIRCEYLSLFEYKVLVKGEDPSTVQPVLRSACIQTSSSNNDITISCENHDCGSHITNSNMRHIHQAVSELESELLEVTGRKSVSIERLSY
jgi:hypothetical protein